MGNRVRCRCRDFHHSLDNHVEEILEEMIMRWIQIDREVVVLYSDEVDGKVIPQKMAVLPVGVFRKLYNNKVNHEKIHQP